MFVPIASAQGNPANSRDLASHCHWSTVQVSYRLFWWYGGITDEVFFLKKGDPDIWRLINNSDDLQIKELVPSIIRKERRGAILKICAR